MNTLVKVARYHLVDRINFALLPVGVLAFAFAVNIVIFATIPKSTPTGNYTGALCSLYIFFLVLGAISVSRSLPFGFALGLTRRAYFLGTVGLAVVLGAVYSAGVVVLQAVEAATGGWGTEMHFFRIPWLFSGPWYLNWLTSFVIFILLFIYGMWYGLVFRRWAIPGMVVFAAAQVVVILAAVVAITLADAWSGVGSFFSALDIAALTGVLAAVAVVLVLGGFTTMRRITV